MAEYALIIAAVTIVCVTAYQLLGSNIKATISSFATSY